MRLQLSIISKEFFSIFIIHGNMKLDIFFWCCEYSLFLE